jgi:hypothetical protein
VVQELIFFTVGMSSCTERQLAKSFRILLWCIEFLRVLGNNFSFSVTAESLVDASLEIVVTRYGKHWDGRGAQKLLAKRPLEPAAAVIEDYDLPCTPFDFNAEVLALLQERLACILYH